MGLTAITHSTSPYNSDYIHEMGTRGLNPRFKPKYRGLHTLKMCALRMADGLLKAQDHRDEKWLAECQADRARDGHY